ncbi:hypothetical protein [Arthrobacter sp. Leaf69]|uniref:hypothetical protein n=1 Tax=Arthrobacter sp. Leaf69 TaxID=1736232 RepID=UPI0006FC1DED|nr:hypothetical protein [Arthrobacter sp. Leaf69]KQN86343.1 hypothetical protein ASE96_12175 [Arthrobacter sp. Leaf69]
MDSHNLDLPDTDSYDEELSTGNRARRRWPLAAAVVIVALAAVAGGVAVAGNFRSADPAPAAAPTATMVAPTASASPTVTPSPTTATPVSVTPSASTAPATDGAVSEVANGRYVSAAAGVSFTLPDRWTVEESTNQNPGYPGSGITIFNEARMQVAALYHGATGAVGGACPSGNYKMTELDTAQALDTPWAKAMGVRFSYRVLDMRASGGAFHYQIGLVDKNSGEIKDSCLMYSFVAGAPKGTLIFADRSYQSQKNDDPIFNSLAEAKDYMRSPDYRKLKAMIVSLRMQP